MKKIILTMLFIFLCVGMASAQSALDEYKARVSKSSTASTQRSSQRPNTTVSGVPAGAIMAFDLGGRCPSGWTPWEQAAGRVIVGTGNTEGESYDNNQIGGAARTTIPAESIEKGKTMMSGITLKVQENKTPPYVLVADTSVVLEECINREKHCTRYPPRPFTIEVGNDDADLFDNRQPFIALTYCRKN